MNLVILLYLISFTGSVFHLLLDTMITSLPNDHSVLCWLPRRRQIFTAPDSCPGSAWKTFEPESSMFIHKLNKTLRKGCMCLKTAYDISHFSFKIVWINIRITTSRLAQPDLYHLPLLCFLNVRNSFWHTFNLVGRFLKESFLRLKLLFLGCLDELTRGKDQNTSYYQKGRWHIHRKYMHCNLKLKTFLSVVRLGKVLGKLVICMKYENVSYECVVTQNCLFFKFIH